MTKQALYGSTDYPFEELGDTLRKAAPRRNIKVIDYDRNKYVTVVVFGGGGKTITAEIKRGYVRPFDWKKRKGRWRTFSHKELCELPLIRENEFVFLPPIPNVDVTQYAIEPLVRIGHYSSSQMARTSYSNRKIRVDKEGKVTSYV